jgi:hypothetical protein
MPLTVASIDAFFAGNSRAANDASNKTREQILATVLTPDAVTDAFFDDAEYGEKWRTVAAGWLEALDWSGGDKLKQMAGRQHNYDFLHVQAGGDSVKVEFKCSSGVAGLNSLPQFLSLAADFDMFSGGLETYAAFYYDRFLDIYLDAARSDAVLPAKPERAAYLKLVRGNNYDSHPFFRWLYDNEDHNKKEKSEIVDQSISSYLLLAAGELDLAKLSAKFADSQGGKKFVFWDMNAHTFTCESFEADDLRLSELVEVTKNSILVEAVSGRKYKMLLRWRNHKGVMLPAWQISLG